ncbi:hypothetical protein ACZ90_52480 [Streptomyces albus subsp. albus]|nr:hypothetical protein ACZ90_52480 [Streptomyces albus subsp. albus]
MSAPTSGSADGSSIPGYYPDPSIPHYIRYWNGVAWVPGTSRPAPAEGESLPVPPPGVAVHSPSASETTQLAGAVPDETGPMFLDQPPEPRSPGGAATDAGTPTGPASAAASSEPTVDLPGSDAGSAPLAWDDPQRLHGSRPEPATAWQADTARQSGFGGEHDGRISWGSDGTPGARVPDPRAGALPGEGAAAGGGVQPGQADGRPGDDPEPGAAPRHTTGANAPAAQTPPAQQGPAPVAPGGEGRQAAPGAVPAQDGRSGPAPAGSRASHPGEGGPRDGTLTLRAVDPGAGAAPSGRDRGTLTIRALGDTPEPKAGTAAPGPTTEPAPAAGQGSAGQGAVTAAPGMPGTAAPGPASAPNASAPSAPSGPAAQPRIPGQGRNAPAATPTGRPGGGLPADAAPDGGAPAWGRQAHQPAPRPGSAAGPAGPEGVIPWKPPTDNPFLRAAQAQGRPAALGRRLAARLIDTLLLLAVVGAAAVPLWSKAKDHIDTKIDEAKQTGETVTVYLLDGTTGLYLGILLGVLLLVGALAEALPTARWGRTLGKRLCGLRTLDIESHQPPSFGAALRRWLVYGVLGVLVIGVLNVLWCLFDRPWRQCWHDKAARTFVATGG